jgi:hypothetical protein
VWAGGRRSRNETYVITRNGVRITGTLIRSTWTPNCDYPCPFPECGQLPVVRCQEDTLRQIALDKLDRKERPPGHA